MGDRRIYKLRIQYVWYGSFQNYNSKILAKYE
jgi:hypothetical protein